MLRFGSWVFTTNVLKYVITILIYSSTPNEPLHPYPKDIKRLQEEIALDILEWAPIESQVYQNKVINFVVCKQYAFL